MLSLFKRKSKKENPLYPQARNFVTRNDHVSAIKIYDCILIENPRDTTALLERSVAKMNLRSPDIDGACEDINQALDVDQMSCKIWSQKGRVSTAQGQYTEAEDAYWCALDLADPSERPGLQILLRQAQREMTARVQASGAALMTPSIAPLIQPASTSTTPVRHSNFINTAASGVNVSSTLQQPLASLSLSPSSSPPPPQYSTVDENRPTPQASTAHLDVAHVESLRKRFSDKEKGMIQVLATTSVDKLDCLRIGHVGEDALVSTLLDASLLPKLHDSLSSMTISELATPGTTTIDQDAESWPFYQGLYGGTVSISGLNEEYRDHQLTSKPKLQLVLESDFTLTLPTSSEILKRLDWLRTNPQGQDDNGLLRLLGLRSWSSGTLATALLGSTSTQLQQIDTICLALNKARYASPGIYLDWSTPAVISPHFLAGPRGIGVTAFLFQIMLGCELVVRMKKVPPATSMAGILTHNTSMLMILAVQWMENVGARLADVPASPDSPQPTTQKVLSAANRHTIHITALLKFAEQMGWPLLSETRPFLHDAYDKLLRNELGMAWHVRDWLFGMHRPGKHFRHLLLSTLVQATPSISSLDYAPIYEDGLLIQKSGVDAGPGVSYWPSISTMGRVLGGLSKSQIHCGIVGPVKVPILSAGTTLSSTWIYVNAIKGTIPVPVSGTMTTLGRLELNTEEARAMPPSSIYSQLTDPTNWIAPTDLPGPRSSSAELLNIKLDNPKTVLTATADLPGGKSSYRAALAFKLTQSSIASSTATTTTPSTSQHAQKTVSFTLYYKVTFVSAPRCILQSGTTAHPMFHLVSNRHLSHTYKIWDLHLIPGDAANGKTIIIDARGENEECVARAWCSETGQNAIVRRSTACCFSCTMKLASKEEGIGFRIVIWGS